MIQPLPGDFEVVPTGGTGGKLIQIAQILSNTGRLDYEHARLYLGSGKIVEAEPGGAVIRDYDVRKDDGGLWSTGLIDLTKDQRNLIISAGYKYGYAHVGYSELDYAAIAAYKFKIGVLAPGLKTYVASSKHMICSQLVDQCYQDGGIRLFDDGRWPGYVTPGDLADLLTQLAEEHALT